jgi:uncharacterized protein YjeT (DUF2065 family)
MIILFMGGYLAAWAGESKNILEELSKLSENDIKRLGLVVFGIGFTMAVFAWFIIQKG